MGPRCVFCEILAGREKAHIVAEDEYAVSFLDHAPITTGHTLVVPRRHVEGLTDLPAEERAPFLASVQSTARLIQENLRPDGLNFGVNEGEAAGQIVFHLHMHIIPRFAHEKHVFTWTRRRSSPEELAAVAASIKGDDASRAAARDAPAPLSEQEAFLGVVLCAVAADGRAEESEFDVVGRRVAGVRLFADVPPEGVREAVQRVVGRVRSSGVDRFLDQARGVLRGRDLETAFEAAAEVVQADREVDAREMAYLEQVRVRLGVPDAVARRVFEAAGRRKPR